MLPGLPEALIKNLTIYHFVRYRVVMAFAVSPLSDVIGFGALVSGLDAADLASSEMATTLRQLWTDRGVLVFRGLPDDPETHVALSRVFGEPDVHPFKQLSGQGAIQELTDIFYRPDRGDIVRLADGTRLGAWLPWHFDLVYFERINRGGVLRGIDLPDEGGSTGFIDGVEAYDRLSSELQDEMEGRSVVYRFDGDLAGLRFGGTPGLVLERMNEGSREAMARMKGLPPVAHPLVFEHPASGRKVLHFSPWFALGIEGATSDDSRQLLDAVTQHLIQESRAYFHHWRKGDMVLCDNWRMVHCATGVSAERSRHMQRTTIRGDYGLGRPAECAGAE
jgi:taurine dioxygenase